MVGLGQATIGLLLARVAAAQSFTNTSTPATGNNSTETCTYSPSDCAARSSVLSCQALHTSWYSDRNSWTASVTTSSSPAYSYEYSSVIWLGNQSTSLSTLCDGVLRGGKPPAITSTSTTTFYEYFPQYPVPEPTCTYDYNACALLISEYRDAPRGPTASVAPRYPACAWDTEECFNPAGAICPIKVGEVKLIYWPQSKDPSKLCASNTSGLPASITPSPSGPPVTTVIGSYTLTSPTVYLSYPYMEALLCWKSFRDIIVPLTNPNDLSSISFVSPAQSSKTMSFNWDDLNSPVPLSAYKGQQSCVEIWNTVRTPFDNCSTVYDDYNPWLVLPTNPLVYTDIDPRFKNCTSIQYSKYVIDPPLALTTAGLLVPEPSSAPPVTSKPEATEPASETASPAPEPAPPTVTATTTQAVPVTQPTAEPEDPADPPSDSPADPPADPPSDPSADPPADPPTTTGGGGGGLGPIISQIASSAAAGQPNNPPVDDPAAPPPANDNDPSNDPSGAPANPGTDNDDNNNGNNAPPPVVTIIPAPAPPSDPDQPSDPSDPSDPDNSGGSNTGGDPIIIASPAADPSNPGAVVIIAGPAGGSDPGDSTTTTLLPGATGVLPGGTAGAGSVTVAVPSTGGAVVVGGSETVAVPTAAAGVTATAAGVSGGGSATAAGEVGAVITGADGAVVTAVAGNAGGAGGGSVVVVGGVTVTAGGEAVTVPGVGVVSAVSGGSGGVVVDGGSTAAFSTIGSGDSGSGGSAVVVTLGGEVETASAGPGGIVVVDGTTLTVGGAAVTASDGVVVSAATGGIVVDGTTVPFGSSTSSGTTGAATTRTADESSSTASGTSDGDSAPASSTSSSGAAPLLGDSKVRTVLMLFLPVMIF